MIPFIFAGLHCVKNLSLLLRYETVICSWKKNQVILDRKSSNALLFEDVAAVIHLLTSCQKVIQHILNNRWPRISNEAGKYQGTPHNFVVNNPISYCVHNPNPLQPTISFEQPSCCRSCDLMICWLVECTVDKQEHWRLYTFALKFTETPQK